MTNTKVLILDPKSAARAGEIEAALALNSALKQRIESATYKGIIDDGAFEGPLKPVLIYNILLKESEAGQKLSSEQILARFETAANAHEEKAKRYLQSRDPSSLAR